MSLYFIHSLIESVFGAPLVIDADAGHVEALRLREPIDAGTALFPAQPAPLRPGTALAVNIGQHLTSWGLVRLNGDGDGVGESGDGYAVTGLLRRQTCPNGAPCCLTEEIGGLLAEVRDSLGASAADVEAVGIAVAATVMDGAVRPVPEFGLFALCPESSRNGATELLAQACREAFPGRPTAIVNDAKAQALFAFHYAEGRQAAGGRHMLAVRLGACPCVHCLDRDGQSAPGFDEYGWLVAQAVPVQAGGPLFSTPRLPLSHYGVAAAAHELGLLARHNLDIEAAIPFFHERLLGDDALARHEAAGVYGILGAHLAMLSAEIHSRRPLGAVMLLGSQANRLDEPVFAAMREGYAAFAADRPLVPGQVRLALIKDASARAGLIGAARAALTHASTPVATA